MPPNDLASYKKSEKKHKKSKVKSSTNKEPRSSQEAGCELSKNVATTEKVSSGPLTAQDDKALKVSLKNNTHSNYLNYLLTFLFM